MREIRVWQVDMDDHEQPQVKQIGGVEQTRTEQLLEEIFVRRPELLLKDLRLVGRQTDTPGGPLDLLGIDSDGQLIIFELKRGVLTREAVAQVIDYASFLAELDPDELADHIAQRSGKLGIEKIDDFLVWYQEQFAKSLSRPQKPKMVLVGLGADDRARRMVSYLADSEVDISLVTFHGFRDADKILLARQVEVESKPPGGTPKITKTGNLEQLRQRVAKMGLDEFYYEMARFFHGQLSAYQWPNPGGYSYSLPELTESGSESNRVYVALYLNDARPGQVRVYLPPRAVEAASDSFAEIQETLGKRLEPRPDRGADVWISPAKEWNELVPVFEKLCSAIVKGWKTKREQEANSEMQLGEDGES